MTRAGATGGGRTYRGQMPVKWYASLVLICLLGLALVVYSRYERAHPAPATQPAIGSHWFQALSFDVCGKLQPNLPTNPNESKAPVPGIHTDGDGVIQVEPTTAADAGNNATLARFVETYPGLTLTSSELKLPKGRTYTNGKTCPAGTPQAGKAGVVQINVWANFTGPASNHPQLFNDPSEVKLADDQLITVAFVPSGAAIPKPNSIVALLNDRAQAESASTTVPATVPPTTTPSTSTTVGSATTTTAVGAATTTTKPAATTTTTKP